MVGYVASLYCTMVQHLPLKGRSRLSICKQLRPCHMMGSRYIRASNVSSTHRLIHLLHTQRYTHNQYIQFFITAHFLTLLDDEKKKRDFKGLDTTRGTR